MRSRAGLVAAVLALVVAGCGGSGASASPSATPVSSSPPVQTSAAPVATPAPTPVASAATASGTTYVVKKGDTLYGIATRHKVTVKAILAANPDIKDPNFIKIGQKLVIPAP